jgi:hypothetical protein
MPLLYVVGRGGLFGTSRLSGAGLAEAGITSQGLLARGKSMDTISISLYYSFF